MGARALCLVQGPFPAASNPNRPIDSQLNESLHEIAAAAAQGLKEKKHAMQVADRDGKAAASCAAVTPAKRTKDARESSDDDSSDDDDALMNWRAKGV